MEDLKGKVHHVWDEMAAGWTRDTDIVWESSRKVSEQMVAALDPRPGHTILELAAGTGDTGFLAAGRIGPNGRVICSDFVEGMVAGARDRASAKGIDNVEFRVIDAEAIDLPDDSVDGVLCRWGYMLMPDPQQALRETRRVLHQNAKLVFSVWGAPGDNPWATVIGKTMTQIGRPPKADPTGPGGVFSMAQEEIARDMAAEAGFREIVFESVPMTWRFGDFDELWGFYTEVAGAVAFLINELDEDDRAAFRSELKGELAEFETNGGYAIPGLCLNATAS